MAPSLHSPVPAIIAQHLAPDESAFEKQPLIEHDLNLSFEELCRGCNKKLTVQIRDPFDGTRKNEVISIKIKPGMTPGTRIPFPQLASSEQGGANTFLVVRDKANQRFKRLNDTDLEFTAYLTSDELKNGAEMLVPTPENDPITLYYEDEIETPEEVFFGRGLPTFGNKKNRGKLVVRFVVSDDPKMKNQQIYQQFGKEENEVILIARLTKAQEVNRDRSKTESTKESEHSLKSFKKVRVKESLRDELMKKENVANRKSTPNWKATEMAKEKLPANHYDIKLSLEEIYRGTVKKQVFDWKYTNSYGRVKQVSKTLLVVIKAGSIEGTQIVHPSEGDQAYQKNSADVIFTIREEAHPTFQRIGHDIEYGVKITQRDAMYGANLKIPTLDGSLVDFTFKTPVQHGDRQKIEGRGLPILGKKGQFGDLWVKFEVYCGVWRLDFVLHEINDFLNLEDEIVDPPITHDFNVSLRQILTGCIRRMKINRLIINQSGSGEEKVEIVPITVKPGAKEGTIFTFPRYGDQALGHIPADIIFKLCYKPHEFFRLCGHDLVYEMKVLKSQIRKREKFTVPTLKDGPKEICLENIAETNTRKIISGQGLPIAENSSQRGDLIVHIDIENDSKDDPEYDPEVLHDPIKLPNMPELPVHQDLDIVIGLPLSLEDILEGYNSRIQFVRLTYDKNGDTIAREGVDVPISVPPGARLDTRITFPNCGHIKPGTQPGDVVISIFETAHKTFRRNGADLECTITINNKQAKNGGKVMVPTLSGHNIEVNLAASIGPDTIQRIADFGLPRTDLPSKRGDLVLHFDIAPKKGLMAKVVDFISKCTD